MECVIMICVLSGCLCGLWEMYNASKNPEESDSEEDLSRDTEGFDRGYYKQRRGMFDNFK